MSTTWFIIILISALVSVIILLLINLSYYKKLAEINYIHLINILDLATKIEQENGDLRYEQLKRQREQEKV
jgi:hypothetical protein